jgi:pescadillo protein
VDALVDLDDHLSLVHMFAALPAAFQVRSDRTASARRLAREWQYYVARSRSLRRVFLSVKGVYYQADVQGTPVTWLAPWQFAQDAPADVDYRVMLTFLELGETVLKFVQYKLYRETLRLAYPPAIRCVHAAVLVGCWWLGGVA